jgi:hypothetical protein
MEGSKMSLIHNNPVKVAAAGKQIATGTRSGIQQTGEYNSRTNSLLGVIDGMSQNRLDELLRIATRGGNAAYATIENINRFLERASRTTSTVDRKSAGRFTKR